MLAYFQGKDKNNYNISICYQLSIVVRCNGPGRGKSKRITAFPLFIIDKRYNKKKNDDVWTSFLLFSRKYSLLYFDFGLFCISKGALFQNILWSQKLSLSACVKAVNHLVLRYSADTVNVLVIWDYWPHA